MSNTVSQDYASYEASSFCINATTLHFDQKGMIVKEDFPALIHEWWHYMQDITMISGQNGFYLWLRDIVCMTKITCGVQNQTITIPLPHDQYDQSYNKHRQLYNIFCGGKEDVPIDNPVITKEPTVEANGIKFDGENRTFAKCTVTISDKDYYFGLIALQELNAYYIQKIVEGYVPGTKFNVPADSLMTFPYKLGDLLFDYYDIKSDLRTRFMVSTLPLDTIQSPAVFLKLLQALRGKSLNYVTDRNEILDTFHQVSSAFSYPNCAAQSEWAKDYENWLNDPTHTYLRESLKWYISQLALAANCQDKCGEDTFPFVASGGLQALQQIYATFPAPLIKRGNEIFGQDIQTDDARRIAAQHDFDNALVIWSHRRIYDLLRSKTPKELMDNSACPLFNDGKCPYLTRYASDKSYDCKTAPWLVVKGEKKAVCPYAVAAHSMGLWQNEVNIDDSLLR